MNNNLDNKLNSILEKFPEIANHDELKKIFTVNHDLRLSVSEDLNKISDIVKERINNFKFPPVVIGAGGLHSAISAVAAFPRLVTHIGEPGMMCRDEVEFKFTEHKNDFLPSTVYGGSNFKLTDNFSELESKYKFIDSNLKVPNNTSPLDYFFINKTMDKIHKGLHQYMLDSKSEEKRNKILESKQKVISKYINKLNSMDNKVVEYWRDRLIYTKNSYLDSYLSRFPNLNNLVETKLERKALESIIGFKIES